MNSSIAILSSHSRLYFPFLIFGPSTKNPIISFVQLHMPSQISHNMRILSNKTHDHLVSLVLPATNLRWNVIKPIYEWMCSSITQNSAIQNISAFVLSVISSHKNFIYYFSLLFFGLFFLSFFFNVYSSLSRNPYKLDILRLLQLFPIPW